MISDFGTHIPKLKICGMRNTQNIKEILALNPDYLGFIFYKKSKRNVGDILDENLLNNFPKTTQKVGVFVNATVDFLLEKVEQFGLDIAQLHGEETPKFCKQVGAKVKVSKVFSVGQSFDFQQLEPYKPHCDYFLFDTKGKEKGGNGTVFNWEILKDYDNEIPFFLAGGISLENVRDIAELKDLNLHAIDVNSKFEIEPALKDVEKLKQLIDRINRINRI